MGSFMGHAVPGSFFIGFSIWWMVSIFRRHFETKFSNGRYHNTASYRCSYFPNVPLEGYIKLVLISVGVVGEAVTGFEGGHFIYMDNGHHITMFSFFIFNAIVDILYFYRPGLLPENVDYLTGIIAICTEGFLFSWHLHGRSEVDVQVHTFLVYIVVFTIIFTVMEMLHRDKVVYGLGRALGTLVQGTWFWQIGFSLYNPIGASVENSHHEMMIMTLVFSWHLGSGLVLEFVIGLLVYITVKRKYPDVIAIRNNWGEVTDQPYDSEEEETLLITKGGDYSVLPHKLNA